MPSPPSWTSTASNSHCTPPQRLLLPLHAGCQAANIDLIVDNSAALGSSNVVALRDAIADLVEGVRPSYRRRTGA